MNNNKEVIKSFENKDAGKFFFKALEDKIITSLWIDSLIVAIICIISLVGYYVTGNYNGSVFNLLKSSSIYFFLLTGIVFFCEIVSFVFNNEKKCVVDFTETCLIIHKHYIVFKRKLSIDYPSIERINIFSSKDHYSVTFDYKSKNNKDRFLTLEVVPLEFLRTLAQNHQLILVLKNGDEFVLEGDTDGWYLEQANPGNEDEPLQWHQFQQYVQNNPSLELVANAQLENYSNLPNEEVNDLMKARYKLKVDSEAYAYLDYDAGLVFVYLPSNNHMKLVNEIKRGLAKAKSEV